MSDGFFVTDLPATVTVRDIVTLTGREAHHAATVRRLRIGETVTLTDGRGQGVAGPVISADDQTVAVAVEHLLTVPASQPSITVVQALPKNDRAELAVDLMTEVGVDRIVPWQAARSIVHWSGERGERARDKWVAVARESSKQARRLRFPVISPLASTADVARLVAMSATTLIMHERATELLTASDVRDGANCIIVIGPEGGLTEEEVEQFRLAGGRTYSLGPTVLRTSTAGAVAVTQVRLLAGTPR